VALLVTRTLGWESAHREVLWSTARGFNLLWAKLLAGSLVATFLIVVGAGSAFLNPSVRENLVLAGAQYLPLYLFFAWLRVLTWVALTAFFFYLFRSRWATIPLVGAVQVAWFLTAGFWGRPSLIRLLHRNLLAWNFTSAFAPLGIIPIAFFLQGLSAIGLVLAVVGGGFWLRQRFPEWQRVKRVQAFVTLALGVCVVVGGAVGIRKAVQDCVAPWSALDLWDGRTKLDHPYVWSGDFRLLVHPGKYLAARLPLKASIPTWLQELASSKEVRRYDDVGLVILKGHLGSEKRVGSQSLILAYPPGAPWPPELDGLVESFRRAASPLMDRAQLWLGPASDLKVEVLWPLDVFPPFFPREYDLIVYANGELRIYCPLLLRSVRRQQWETAWALTTPVALDGTARAYLAMYLMAGTDKEGVELALEWLRYIRDGKEIEFYKKYGVGAVTLPFYKYAHAPGGAEQILCHWQQGEELGHENYIRALVEGGGG